MSKIVRVLAPMALLVLLTPGSALAVKTQVSQSAFKTNAIYGRSDGVYQDATSGGLWAIENGTAARPLSKGYFEDFTKYAGTAKGISCLDQSDGSTCAGDTTTVPGILTMGDGLRLMQFPVVTATLPVTMTSTGLDITGDLTDNDGFEVTGGVLSGSGSPFIIGDDPAFYFCATIKLTDVSGSDEMMAGFRRAEPFQAAFTGYADYAAIGNVSGDIKTETEVNAGGTTTTDTTDNWADAETHKLCTYVSAAGVATYKVDGSAPTTTVSFTFDDGDPVVPTVYLRHDSDIAETTAITKWEVGYQQ